LSIVLKPVTQKPNRIHNFLKVDAFGFNNKNKSSPEFNPLLPTHGPSDPGWYVILLQERSAAILKPFFG
jgi:hypothetical protein